MILKNNNWHRFPVLLLATLLITTSWSQQTSAQTDKATKKEPVKISGIFESVKAVELKVGTEQTKNLVIEKILPHGKQVDQDQPVVWFKTDAIEKLIHDGSIDLKLAELALQDAEFKHQQFLATQELDRNVAVRNWERAGNDFEFYQSVDRDYQKRSAKIELGFSQQAVENAQDEYDQLKKMYLEDELIEESEEIVLKRTKWQLDNAKFRLEGAKNRYQRTMEETLPRTELEQKERYQRAELAYEAAMNDLDASRARREQELEKQQAKFSEQREKLDELRDERKRMVLRAPLDGMLVHGGLTRGALGERNILEAGKPITADQVVVTIVPASRLQVRLSVNETDLRHLRVGKKVKIISNLYPNQPISGQVQSLASVPYSGTKFDCVVKFQPGNLLGQLIPMTECRVEVANIDPAPAKEKSPADSDKKSQPAATAETSAPGQEPSTSQPSADTPHNATESEPSDEQPAAKEDPISGVWDGTVTLAGQEVARFEMTLKLAEDDTVTGTIRANDQSMEISDGKFDRSNSKFIVTIPGAPFNPEFAVSGNEMTAEITERGVTINIRAVKR